MSFSLSSCSWALWLCCQPRSSACTWKCGCCLPRELHLSFVGWTPAARTPPSPSAAAVLPRGPWLQWAEPWLDAFLAGG